MAWLEQHPVAGTYQPVFRLGGVKFKRSLKILDEREATTRLARVEENIRLLESGRLVLPEQADPAAFLLSDGQLNGKPQVAERLPLSKLMERYKASLPEGGAGSRVAPHRRTPHAPLRTGFRRAKDSRRARPGRLAAVRAQAIQRTRLAEILRLS